MSTEDIFSPNLIVKEITDVLRDRIIDLEKKHSIPAGYLKTALALHIPKFSLEEIYTDGNVEFQTPYLEAKRLALILGKKINSLPKGLKHLVTSSTDKLSKVKHNHGKIIEVDIQGKELEIEFKEVDPEIGFAIQENLHYIGKRREDTLIHLGLFRKGEQFPFAYSAYSKLDRIYLQKALPFDVEMEKMLVLTRAYNINGAPVNAMSLLFSLGAQFIVQKFKETYTGIISAVNPNILFYGSIFKGSSFYTFATVPFLPIYFDGNYVTRKSIEGTDTMNSGKLIRTKIECKPTIWMGHGFSKKIADKFMDSKIVHISEESYLQG